MRRKPYTTRGISRVPCAKCGQPSAFQWQICSDGSQFRGLCARHDVDLNTIASRYIFGRKNDAQLRAYAEEKGVAFGGRVWPDADMMLTDPT